MNEPQEPRSTPTEHPAPEELSEFAFSPEDAAEGLREHVADCPACAVEVEDLRTVLASLAQLPEPVVPVSVGIRLDAAIARAWQEADARPEPAASPAAGASRSPSAPRRAQWRKLVLPLTAVCLIVLAVVGAGKLLSPGGSSTSSAGGNSAAAAAPALPTADSALTQWVRSLLPAEAGAKSPSGISPLFGTGTSGASNRPLPQAECAGIPPRAGYTVLTTSQREFHGEHATLVVYQDDQEPASRPLLAVVYAGSCQTVSSTVLDEGVVSR